MKLSDWAINEIERAKLLEHKSLDEIKKEAYEKYGKTSKAEDEIELELILNNYSDLVYDSALKLFNVFSKQNHSGISANLTKKVFSKLVDGIPLTPVMGTEDEWDTTYEEKDYSVNQNKRFFSLFKYVDKKTLESSYSYNDTLVIVNNDDVWKKYPPEGYDGTLDDNHPLVIKYFNEIDKLKKKLNSKITFPFKAITHYYTWDFDSQKFVKNRLKKNKRGFKK